MDKIQEWIRYNFQDQFETQAQEYEEKIQALKEESRKELEAMKEALTEKARKEKDNIVKALLLLSSTPMENAEIARITGLEESRVKEIAESL